MRKAFEVFTPNDLPTFTYIERAPHQLERRLRDALATPKMIISLSGPSKSGKTVLVNKVVEKDNLISVSGASIRTPEDLWNRVLNWMEVPVERTERTGAAVKGEAGAQGGGKVGIPLLAEAKAGANLKIGGERTSGVDKKFATHGLPQVVREIGESSYTVFVDDFHYVEREVQERLGQQIKEAAEAGVRICTASVPHRADDVVRSNPELRGRVTAIDTKYWTRDELKQIGYRGFRELNVDLADDVLLWMSEEACGSPQLMQAICLNFCFARDIKEARTEHQRLDVDRPAMVDVLQRTSAQTDFSSMLRVLHAGPKQRGTERKEFELIDGSRGDVYRCVLLAIAIGEPRLSFKYDQMLERVQSVCIGDSPAGSSVTSALAQMMNLAKTQQDATVIEWDERVLDIVEPYFLFFLRSSSYLLHLGAG